MPDLIDLNEHRQRTVERAKQLAEVKQRREEVERELEIEILRETLLDTIFRLEVLGRPCKEGLLPTEEELTLPTEEELTLPTEEELTVDGTMFSRLMDRVFSG